MIEFYDLFYRQLDLYWSVDDVPASNEVRVDIPGSPGYVVRINHVHLFDTAGTGGVEDIHVEWDGQKYWQEGFTVGTPVNQDFNTPIGPSTFDTTVSVVANATQLTSAALVVGYTYFQKT